MSGGDVLKAALAYARRGWPVFPVSGIGADGACTCGRNGDCPSPGKHPLTSSRGFKDATTDPSVIKAWWRDNPQANIAVATGEESGLVVLDVDPRNGGDVTSLGALPDTAESLTGGGGVHLFFAHPGGGQVRSRAGFGPGLDLKADGGYVLLPPSRHASGQRYNWLGWDLAVPLAAVPLALLNGHNARAKGTVGERNTTLTSMAGTLRRRGLSEAEIVTALLEENEKNDPPLDRDEVLKIARSICRYPPGPHHLTDLGNAQRVVEQHGHDLRYCFPWRKWLVWTGQRWKPDDTGEVRRRAKETVKSIYAEAAQTTDDNERRALAKWAASSESAAKLAQMITVAESEPGIPVLPEGLDADLWALNVENGTIDLRTGELRAHRREDMITKVAPVRYDPQAACPTWLAFLDRVMGDNRPVVDFLMRSVGHALTGDVREQVLWILYGLGRNGKTTFLEVIQALLGDYAQTAAPGLLIAKRGDRHPTEVADLKGARFVGCVEVAEGGRLHEEQVKRLTGGDTVKARRMHEDFWSFSPTHKLWVACNHKPEIRGTDLAIWRRIRLVPFEVTIPAKEVDKALSDKLKAEVPGILNWAVKGCLEWQRSGLQEPSEVKAATVAYRSESDNVSEFLESWCEPGGWVSAGKLYATYVDWAKANGEEPISQTLMGKRLKARGYEAKKGAGERLWTGLHLHNVSIEDAL